MNLTQIQLDEVKRELSYNPETGEFTYVNSRFLPRRHQELMAAPKPLKVAHRVGDRADKVYGNQFVGVYVLKKVLNAAHVALYLTSGHWPQAVKYVNGDWTDLRACNLEARTRSQQTAEAAQSRYEGFERKLPPNIYGTSAGRYIARQGSKRTRDYESVREAVQAMKQEKWLA